jgi:dihydrofolate reductase
MPKVTHGPTIRQTSYGRGMRQVVYSVAMSLDGYIAGPHGESDWIVVDPEIDFAAIFARFDVIVMGRKTYELTRTHQAASMPGVTSFVFSRTLSQSDCRGVTVSDDPWRTIPALKEEAGKDIWLFGGGELFRSLLEIGLVDRVSVAIVPVLLGGGLPLLPDSPSRAQLRLEEERVYPKTGTVSLEYSVVQNRPRRKRSIP